jgi:hypothetical protein
MTSNGARMCGIVCWAWDEIEKNNVKCPKKRLLKKSLPFFKLYKSFLLAEDGIALNEIL